MADKKRIVFLDYTKAIGMLMIILAHTSHHIDFAGQYAWIPQSFHVPLFFIAVGLVHAYFPPQNNIKSFISKRFWALIIPYIIFSFINSILKLGGLFAMHNLNSEAIKNEIFELMVNGNGPVWFLATLFFADIVYAITPKTYKGFLAIACVFAVYAIGDCHNQWLYPLVRVIAAYPLIYLGSISKCLFDAKPTCRILVMTISFALWVVLVSNTENDYAFRPGFFHNPLHSLPLMLCGSYAFMLLSTFLPSGIGFLNYIGKNSLGYLLIHPTLEMMYALSLGAIVNHFSAGIQTGAFVALFVIVLIVCYPINELILKICPIALGKRRKSN